MQQKLVASHRRQHTIQIQKVPRSRDKLHLPLMLTHRLNLEQLRRRPRALYRKAPATVHQLHSRVQHLSHPRLPSQLGPACHHRPKLVRSRYHQSTTRRSILGQLSPNRILHKSHNHWWITPCERSRPGLRLLQARSLPSIIP